VLWIGIPDVVRDGHSVRPWRCFDESVGAGRIAVVQRARLADPRELGRQSRYSIAGNVSGVGVQVVDPPIVRVP
jgi:hypothetical protein